MSTLTQNLSEKEIKFLKFQKQKGVDPETAFKKLQQLKSRDKEQSEETTKQAEKFASVSLPGDILRVLGKYEGARECVGAARSLVKDLPTGLFNYDSKKKIINSDTPEIGSVAIMPSGSVGHVGVVIGLAEGFALIYDANSDGRNTEMIRRVPLEKIDGYFKGNPESADRFRMQNYFDDLSKPVKGDQFKAIGEAAMQISEFNVERVQDSIKSEALDSDIGAIIKDKFQGQLETLKGILPVEGASPSEAFLKGFTDPLKAASGIAKFIGDTVQNIGKSAVSTAGALPEAYRAVTGQATPEDYGQLEQAGQQTKGAILDVGSLLPTVGGQFVAGLGKEVSQAEQEGRPMIQGAVRGVIQGGENAALVAILNKLNQPAGQKEAQVAKKAGISDADITSTTRGVPKEQSSALLSAAEKAAKDRFAQKPLEMIGRELNQFYDEASTSLDDVGRQIGQVTNSMKGQGILQMDDMFQFVKGRLDDLNVKVTKNGLNFSKSDIAGLAGDQKLLVDMWNKVKPRVGRPASLPVRDAVAFTRNLGNQLYQGAKQQTLTASEGVASGFRGQLRNKINQLADDLGMPQLKELNESYHQLLEVADQYRRFAGTEGLKSPQVLRRAFSNVGEIPKDFLQTIDDVSRRFNFKSGQNLLKKADIAIASENVAGLVQPTSLKGQMKEAMKELTVNFQPSKNILQTAITPLAKIYRAISPKPQPIPAFQKLINNPPVKPSPVAQAVKAPIIGAAASQPISKRPPLLKPSLKKAAPDVQNIMDSETVKRTENLLKKIPGKGLLKSLF